MSFKCGYCDATFVFRYELIIHRESHKQSENTKINVVCELCDKVCFNIDHLKNHVNQHIQIQKYICGKCNKIFVTENWYLNHINTHVDYKCTLCDKTFASKRNLTEHIRIHTRETPHTCEICGKLFVRRDKFMAHLKVHNRGKENFVPEQEKSIFRCNICSKKYTRKSNLKLHERSHTSEVSDCCECECCGQRFLRPDHVARHKLMHKCDFINKKCHCAVCGGSFSKGLLKAHMIEQHDGGKMPYKCNRCDKTFKNKGNLLFHSRIHEGSKKTSHIN